MSTETFTCDCCDGDCCGSMTAIPSLRVVQLNPGDTSVIVCWCDPDHICADEYELAWLVNDTGVNGPVTRVSVPLGTTTYPCDFNPDEAGDGGASDGCENTHTITGLTPGINRSIEINMRKKNTASATAGSCGPWLSTWDGIDANWTNGATHPLLP
jgi:hypothetical protein